MKKFLAVLLLIGSCFLAACGENKPQQSEAVSAAETVTFISISADEAKEKMESETGYIILDVRTKEEFDAGHIPGAVLIPDYEIEQRAESELTDKNQLILVYCRSGRRSKLAAQALADMGYTNVVEFGGIIDWEYETQR